MEKKIIDEIDGDYATKFKEKHGITEPTKVIKVEGVGTCKVYGKLNAEKLIKKLLEYESITG